MIPENNVREYERTYCGKDLVILLFPYRPFRDFKEGCGEVSAYYLISNEAYGYTKKRIAELKAEGFDAELVENVSWKQILIQLGLAVAGRNSLAYTPEFGSFFVMMIVTKNGQIEDVPPYEHKLAPACEGCKSCRRRCPVGAIDEGLAPDECLRHYMVRGEYPDEIKDKVGKRLLGCDTCQRVCRMNAHITPVDPPEELERLFSLEKLLRLDKETLTEIGGAIGKNYARKRYLTALASVAAGNSGEEYRDLLKELADHEDERIAKAARYYLK